ncbi:MAG: hypothetical protein GTN78_05355 [Gemmatimonadales bacterium]|nr:hypothetical protein [Gemmatimonadales bacterium]NIN12723.1 hypothetical protein [Gemmatimonadales bacterium]NIQ99614.1 hypothetical protein [Gemmatimonadales bacterium]NIS64171.1 hypothetical protein [Gemmatimonadales bacterium]
MCGRFSQAQIAELDRELFKLLSVPYMEPRYNIAPTKEAAAIRQQREGPEREFVLLRWGLIPSWAKDPSIGNRLINARSETVATKPTFEHAFRYRRCLIPADGFYEWQKTERGKQPYYAKLRDGAVFALAGLWERWLGAAQQPVETFTIITTAPNDMLRPLHNRMPVILKPGDYDRWLDPSYRDVDGLKGLLQPYPSSEMAAYPVSRYVNTPDNEGPECIAPIEL